MDHVVFFIAQGPLGPLVAMFFAVFLGPLGPILTFVSLHVLIFSVIFFGLVSFVILFSLFFASDVKAAASRTFGVLLCEKLWLSAFNSRADNTVINYCRSFCKFKAWCLHSTGEVSFLPATSITVSLYLHHLLENSLGSSTIYSAFYAINWVHKLAGLIIAIRATSFLSSLLLRLPVAFFVNLSGRRSPLPQRSLA